MNKLSKRSIDKILLFLNDKEFNYVTLSKREVKILFYIYQNPTSEMFELEQEKDILQHQLEQSKNFIKMIKKESYQSSVTGICDVALKELGDLDG